MELISEKISIDLAKGGNKHFTNYKFLRLNNILSVQNILKVHCTMLIVLVPVPHGFLYSCSDPP